MKYTITLQRKIGKNTFDSLLVLITENQTECFDAIKTLTLMFETNKTFVSSSMEKHEDVTHYFLTYDFQKEQ